MKFSFIVFSILFSSMAFSQVNGSGTISIGNGQTTIGISIGNNNPNQSQLVQRVLLLERAVRDLQIQVYNLSVNDLPSAQLFECSLSAFGKTYFGQGSTENIARSNTRKECLKNHNDMFCEDEDMKCSQLQ